jgi:hypothetical protein
MSNTPSNVKQKLLIAVECQRPKDTADNTMRWVSRGGFPYYFFVPKGKRKKFLDQLEDNNYHYYLAMGPDRIVTRTSAAEYAKQHDYDLMLTIPSDLHSWRKGTAFKPKEIYHFAKAIHNARGQFVKHPGKQIIRFENGAVMERVA